ncbi:hypothetical protein [Rossellomorea marisflavi]|uniref:hypothetical protein n=1 Tax=Rossellomorea marisflavi TaxID=189381 RepID=UPI00345D6474
MIEVTLINNKTLQTVSATYTARELVSQGGEDLLMENMMENLVCSCIPIGETNVIECDCWEQWEDCHLEFDGE